MCLLYEVLSIIHHSKPLTIFLCYKKIKYYKHIFKILILYEKHKENREKLQTGCAIKKTRLKSIINFQRLHIFDHVSKSKTLKPYNYVYVLRILNRQLFIILKTKL